MRLNTYQEKRKFNSTPEPKGVERKTSKFSFVVQRHYASRLHYDFRLEVDGVLKSWAVPKGPSLKAGEKRLAVMTEDHPLDYGSFFGTIPEGNYGAGEVEIWDEGSFEPLEEDLPKSKWNAHFSKQIEKGDLKFKLSGQNINGAFALVRMQGEEGKNWLLIKKSDDYAVKSFKIEDIPSLHVKKNPIDEHLEEIWSKINAPMLATAAKTTKVRQDWIYENKYDGYRAIAKINGGKVELSSRNQNNFTANYPEIAKDLEKIQDNVVLDGELVILNENGISNFQKLQNLKSKSSKNLCFYVFDILYLNGHKVTDLPLFERKDLLKELMKNYEFEKTFFSPYVIREGQKFFEDQIKKGEEGIIAKDSQSRYIPGTRSDNWLKFKKQHSVDAVICGYTEPQNSRKHFGSLVLGLPDGKKIEYIGNVGSGFNSKDLKALYDKFQPLRQDKNPFGKEIKFSYSKGKPIWIKPELIAEISYGAVTDERNLRHPVFVRLRDDKKVADSISAIVPDMKDDDEVTTVKTKRVSKAKLKVEQKKVEVDLSPEVSELISNAKKILFPELSISKEGVIKYYQSIAPYILPHLKNRPLSLYRLPNGIHKNGFFQKDKGNLKLPDFVDTTPVFSESNNANKEYMVCNNNLTLAYVNNLGSIELHAWLSALPTLENPDYILLDLDPDGNDFDEVIEIAQFIHELCEELKFPNFVKTSGKSGIHIFIPLEKGTSYDQSKLTGEILMSIVHRHFPDNTSIERAVASRKGKIYLDFLQNRNAQTVVAPYSLRPVPEASVSMPLSWDNLQKGLRPGDFTINNVHGLLEKYGDAWDDYGKKRLSIEKALSRLQKRYEAD